MDVLVLIDKLDDLVHNAKQVPLTDQVRVDKEEIYDILDQMRATIPEEIKQARWIVKERQEMLAEAKREAERIVKEARERQTRLVSEQEITKAAERAAEDIIEDARAREREIRLGAEDYADEILNTLEVNLTKFVAAVQRGRERLQGKDDVDARADQLADARQSSSGLAPPHPPATASPSSTSGERRRSFAAGSARSAAATTRLPVRRPASTWRSASSSACENAAATVATCRRARRCGGSSMRLATYTPPGRRTRRTAATN